MHVFGFKSKRIAETSSRLAKQGAADFNSRRRTQSRPRNPDARLSLFFATPDGVIGQGTQTNPVMGSAFILQLNTQSGVMERASINGNPITEEVWNMGPRVVPSNPINETLPVIELREDSHGVLWVHSQEIKYGRMTAELTFGNTGTMQVFRNGVDTGETIEVVWDKFEDDEPALPEHDVKAVWVADEKLWRVDNIECPDDDDDMIPLPVGP